MVKTWERKGERETEGLSGKELFFYLSTVNYHMKVILI